MPKGKSYSLFTTMGCRDSTVRLLSLALGGSLLEQRSSTALGITPPHLVVLSNVEGSDGGGEITLMVRLGDVLALRVGVNLITSAISTSPLRRFLGRVPWPYPMSPSKEPPPVINTTTTVDRTGLEGTTHHGTHEIHPIRSLMFLFEGGCQGGDCGNGWEQAEDLVHGGEQQFRLHCVIFAWIGGQ